MPVALKVEKECNPLGTIRARYRYTTEIDIRLFLLFFFDFSYRINVIYRLLIH